CGGDHSLEDQQSQISSDKQSNSSTGPSTNNNTNTLTYQQKRQAIRQVYHKENIGPTKKEKTRK
ncbi:unnamed protein product, partial [Rotaria sp. Silwood1]